MRHHIKYWSRFIVGVDGATTWPPKPRAGSTASARVLGQQRYAVRGRHVRVCLVTRVTFVANSGLLRRVSCRWCPAILAGIPDSVGPMKLRACLLSFAKLAVVVTAAGACAAPRNKILADTPVLPYQAPDIAEITGIEEPDEDAEEQEAPAPAPAPHAQAEPAKEPAKEAAPAKVATPPAPSKPATPTKAPAKPAAPAKAPAAPAPAKAPAPAPEKK